MIAIAFVIYSDVLIFSGDMYSLVMILFGYVGHQVGNLAELIQ